MALEDKTSLLYSSPIIRRRVSRTSSTSTTPVSGQRSFGYAPDTLSARSSLFRPSFSTNSGISGNLSSGVITDSRQASPSQTLPLEEAIGPYFEGDYFVSGYYEE